MSRSSSHSKRSGYMPLTKGSYSDGPSHCVFSRPRVDYSEETQKFVNLLMKESRLTTRQKSGFESILRTGSSLPRRSEDVARRNYFSQRHAVRGKAMGLDLRCIENGLSSLNPFRFVPKGGPCRRSLETIKASGDLDASVNVKKYTSIDKEKEKDILAYKMAFGKNPMAALSQHDMNDEAPKKKQQTNQNICKEDRLGELIDEIKDRVDFLKCMEKIGREKSYHSYIVSQIQEKLTEMHTMSPTTAADIMDCLQLADVDKCFITGRSFVKNLLQ